MVGTSGTFGTNSSCFTKPHMVDIFRFQKGRDKVSDFIFAHLV